jgi:hypothetical protein
MSRTSSSITDTEKAIYTAFCHDHHILNDDSPTAVKNGEHIGGYIALWNVDITEETLAVTLEKLRDRRQLAIPSASPRSRGAEGIQQCKCLNRLAH